MNIWLEVFGYLGSTLVVVSMLMASVVIPGLAEEEDRVIRVSGSAVVSLAADTASIQIGVNTRKDTVKEAQKENAALMYKII